MEEHKEKTTQQRFPARAVFRTTIAMAIGFIPIGSMLIRELGLDSVPFFAVALGVGAAVTRVLAIPETGEFLKKYAPWLHESADGAKHREDDQERA